MTFINIDSAAEEAAKKTAEKNKSDSTKVTTISDEVPDSPPQFKKRSVASIKPVTVSRVTQTASKRVARSSNFSNNKNVQHLPSGRPSFFGESRTAQLTIRLRPTLLQMLMDHGEKEWNEKSRNSIIERLLCKSLDVDLKTLEPRS